MLEHIGSLSVRAQRLANVRAHRLAELALTMPHSHGHALETSWCAHSRDAQHVGISHLSRHIMLVSRISLDISSWYLASLLTHHVGISRRGPEPKASGNRGPEPKASGNRGLASNLAILSCGTPGSPWKPKEAQGAHGSPRKPKEPREPMEIGSFKGSIAHGQCFRAERERRSPGA